MARPHDGDVQTPWWRTLRAILTGAAGFLASVATVLALFIQPGGGGKDNSGDGALPNQTRSSDAIAVSTVTLDGRTPDPIRRRETNLGDLVADAILYGAKLDAKARGAPRADVAFINGGAIRLNTVLAPGNLTESDVHTMLPFQDVVVTVPAVSREEFKALLEHAYARLPATTEAGRFAQIAAFTVHVDVTRPARDGKREPGTRVRRVTLADGTPIVVDGKVRPGRSLNVATGAFLAAGGDAYPFPRGDAVPTRMGYFEALIRYLDAPAAEGGLAGRVLAARYPEGGEGRITVTPPLPALR